MKDLYCYGPFNIRKDENGWYISHVDQEFVSRPLSYLDRYYDDPIDIAKDLSEVGFCRGRLYDSEDWSIVWEDPKIRQGGKYAKPDYLRFNNRNKMLFSY